MTFFADYENCTFTKKHDIDELYAEIKARHKEENFSIQVNVQSERLRPRLREYQKAAVRWMLLREHTTNSHKNSGIYISSVIAYHRKQVGVILDTGKCNSTIAMATEMEILNLWACFIY